jgi:type I restriction enzyme S subunit
MVWNEKLKREIPEGWIVTSLGKLVSSNRGISYNTQSISGSGIPMINLASFNVNGSYKHSGIKSFNGDYSKDKILKPFDLVMCNTQQTAIDFAKDIIGKAFLVPDIFGGDIVSSHHITTLHLTNSALKPYLAYLSNTLHFHKYAAGCCSGTNILGLNYAGLEQYLMEIPIQRILELFESMVLNTEKRKSKLIIENERLTTMRNQLLPLLMNGQVSVNYDLSYD